MSAPAPRRVCLLRLSAIGDTCHVVPVLRTLQHAWPQAEFTWIIGASEFRLMRLLADVEFIIVDKRAGLAGVAALRRQLKGRSFDALLHMQIALRASLIAREVRSALKVGFDRARARELQWLFTNTRIAPRAREHVLDSFFGFPAALGVPHRVLRWDVPLPAEALEHALRNWRAEHYAEVAAHATRAHGMRVILCGGPSAIERTSGAAIVAAARAPLVNLIGRDSLPQMLALLARATVLLTPDSGPAHMATMVGTPVIGLYAATNPARTGPYLSRAWCVDAYPQAARRFRGRAPEELPWTEKIEVEGVMDLIGVEAVTERLEALLRTPRELIGSPP